MYLTLLVCDVKAIKFRIYPTLAQRRQLIKEFVARRHVWNWALECRSSAYKADKTTLNAVALSRLLTQRKASDTSLKAVSATALAYTLRDLDEAFQRFFSKQARYPKRKKFGTVNSVCYQIDKRQPVFRDGELLKLPKLGAVDVVWSKSIPVTPNSATVSKTPDGRWFVSLQYDADDAVAVPKTGKAVGIDLGLTCFAAMSDGNKIKPPRPLRAGLRKLANAQRALSRAKKGSNGRRKAKVRVAKVHSRIADQRADFLHKLSTSIVVEHDQIAVEDLSVRGMMANRKLARSIGDASWSEFRRQLTYKAGWYGKTLCVTPRFSRSTGVCPECGVVGEKLPLSVREWTCACGAVHDRDIAAAQVILKTARNAGFAGGGRNKPNDRGVSPENTAVFEAGKAQFARPHGRGQRTPIHGARS